MREERRRVQGRREKKEKKGEGEEKEPSSVKDAIVLDLWWPLDTETADQSTPLDGERRQP